MCNIRVPLWMLLRKNAGQSVMETPRAMWNERSAGNFTYLGTLQQTKPEDNLARNDAWGLMRNLMGWLIKPEKYGGRGRR